jgi:hypothetical protein
MFPPISSITQQQQQQPAASLSGSLTSSPQAANQKSPTKKYLVAFFSKSFISRGKQGGGATFLGEGRYIVTRETCFPSSVNINNLGKAAVLHFASRSWQTQPVDH